MGSSPPYPPWPYRFNIIGSYPWIKPRIFSAILWFLIFLSIYNIHYIFFFFDKFYDIYVYLSCQFGCLLQVERMLNEGSKNYKKLPRDRGMLFIVLLTVSFVKEYFLKLLQILYWKRQKVHLVLELCPQGMRCQGFVLFVDQGFLLSSLLAPKYLRKPCKNKFNN